MLNGVEFKSLLEMPVHVIIVVLLNAVRAYAKRYYTVLTWDVLIIGKLGLG